jgi:hypothetical protein
VGTNPFPDSPIMFYLIKKILFFETNFHILALGLDEIDPKTVPLSQEGTSLFSVQW